MEAYGSVGPAQAGEESFWWTVEFTLKQGDNRGWDEERLMTLASVSGAIGSELLESEGVLTLRAAYLSSRPLEELCRELKELLPSFEGVSLARCRKTVNRRWDTQHLDAFPPLKIGQALVVMAPWHRPEKGSNRIPIYIYPASAFGTGYHESTRIALELLEGSIQRGDTLLDIGTGTGILFIAALKLGAAKAIARDLDPASIEEARRNMNLNGLNPSLCDLAVGNLLKDLDTQGNVLTSNILLSPNLAMLPEVKRVLKPKGCAIFSGMTNMERGTFLSMLKSSGLTLDRELRFGDWWGCRARRAWG